MLLIIKIIIEEDKIENKKKNLPNILRYFFEAIGYLQKFNYSESENLFHKVLVMMIKQEKHRNEAQNFKVIF